MSILYRAYGNTADCRGNATSTVYATARSSTAATASAALTTFNVGQVFNTPNYTVGQGFYQFDTSAFPASSSGSFSLTTASVSTVPGDILEISETSSLTNKIAGGSLSGLTQRGSFATTGVAFVRGTTTLSGTVPVSATLRYVVHAQNERNNVAPTADQQQGFYAADNTGTTNDPYIEALAGTAWTYVGRGTSVEATATSHILTEPAGVAAGDLLVACIGSRIASTTQITLPSGWTRVAQQLNNNTASTTSATPSGMMAYIVRGASPPSYTFTHPVAPNVALGRVVAYRNVDTSSPFDVGGGATGATALSTALFTGGITTTQDDDLIVTMCAGGQEGTWTSYNANVTGGMLNSGTTADSVLDPLFNQFLERSDIQTITGNDTSLAIFDAIRQTAGSTGDMNAGTSASAANVNIAGAFKLAPAAPTGTTYNETVAETLTAADTVEISQFVRSGPIAETAASAETVAGLLDATRVVAETAAAAETQGGLLVTDKAIAETAAAAETITGGLAFVDTVAETAAAADTITKTVSFTGAIAESASAAETVGGLMVRVGAIAESASAAETVGSLLTFTGAVAETAGAAETIVPDIIPAGAIYDKDQVETAGAADTVGGLLTYNVTVAETAAAAETITRAVSYTGAVAETAAAADTVGGLMVRIGAVAETASAVDTPAGLLTFTAAIAEAASAAETIIPIVVPAGGTLYEETVLETLAANDEFSADVIRASVGGGIGHGGGGGKRRRHLFIYENVPANDDDEEDEEPKPQPKRKLRLKKAEVEEKIEDAIAWIEAGSPRPMAQQALVAEVSAVLDIAALLEADRLRVERTIYRYVAALLAEAEEEEGVAMLLLAA